MTVAKIIVTTPKDPKVAERVKADSRFVRAERRKTPLAVRAAWDNFARYCWPDDRREARRTRDRFLELLAVGRGHDGASLDRGLAWARNNYRPLPGGHFCDDPIGAARLTAQGPVLHLRRIDLVEILSRTDEAHDTWNTGHLRVPADPAIISYVTTGGRLLFGLIADDRLPGITYLPLSFGALPGRDGPMLVRGSRVFSVPCPFPRVHPCEGCNLAVAHAPVLVALLIANEQRTAANACAGVEP
jgi:hypothetical protein